MTLLSLASAQTALDRTKAAASAQPEPSLPSLAVPSPCPPPVPAPRECGGSRPGAPSRDAAVP